MKIPGEIQRRKIYSIARWEIRFGEGIFVFS
jgi:hypothetical protein